MSGAKRWAGKKFVRVFGVDPGPDPGMVMLALRNQRIFEASIPSSLDDGLMEADVVAFEKFLISNATVRRTRAGSHITIGMVEHIKAWLIEHDDVLAREFPASTVKPWASDVRLRSWGLYRMPSRHHRDAARHALYTAVQLRLLPVRAPDDKFMVRV